MMTDLGMALPILPLGDPRLRLTAHPVEDPQGPNQRAEAAALKATLGAFRTLHGFGRGIAAPQVGIPKRFIALDLGEGPWCLLNPRITWRSPQTFTLWDDCMCFPHLLVRVRRHLALTLAYQDEDGVDKVWECTDPSLAELLQHELDHLDGVLAVDRAEGIGAIVSREAFQRDPEAYRAQVDGPPTP